jgi:hypothetical protein
MVSKGAFADGLCRLVMAKGGKWTGESGQIWRKRQVKKPGSPSITPLAGHEERIPWAVGKIVKEAGLGRDPEKKPGCGEAVSIKNSFDDPFGVTPGRPRPQSKGHEVA